MSIITVLLPPDKPETLTRPARVSVVRRKRGATWPQSAFPAEFLLDGAPTYAGRTFKGRTIQGLLFNLRAVQAALDDANPPARACWT